MATNNRTGKKHEQDTVVFGGLFKETNASNESAKKKKKRNSHGDSENMSYASLQTTQHNSMPVLSNGRKLRCTWNNYAERYKYHDNNVFEGCC